MRLLTLPVTIVRVPIEFGFGAAKQAVKVAQGLVGGGEETVVEEPRPKPSPRRKPARRSTNGRSGTTGSRASASRRTASRTSGSRRTARPAPEPAAKERPRQTGAQAAAAPSPAATPPAPAPAGAVSDAIEAVGAAAERAEPEEPTHVSEEPELVAEAAEAGAEDGAGAEVAVDEPWPGYDEMQAADIEDRLVTEGAETAAAVRLYEASRKGRADVLEAASRSLAG